MFFFLFRIIIQDTILHLVVIHLLGFSWFWQFLKLPVLLMTLIVLRSIDQIFYRMSLGVWLMFFSWLDWAYRFGEEKPVITLPQRWSAILIASYQGYILSTWLITVDVNLAKVELVRFLHYKVNPFSLLSIKYFWEESPMHSPHLRSGKIHILEDGVST